MLPNSQVALFEPSVEGPDTPIVLRKASWLAASRTWSTVTPVLLDRPPKRQTPDSVAQALAESLQWAGFPAPEEVTVLGSSDFEGAPGAMAIATRVPRFHARVVFPVPLRGPVIAGRWRNFGIGLFRPTPGGVA